MTDRVALGLLLGARRLEVLVANNRADGLGHGAGRPVDVGCGVANVVSLEKRVAQHAAAPLILEGSLELDMVMSVA